MLRNGWEVEELVISKQRENWNNHLSTLFAYTRTLSVIVNSETL